MATLPSDMIFNGILPRLPAKSLARFKCVSKSWLTLISSPHFVALHLRHSLSSDANRLLILAGKHQFLYLFDLDTLPKHPAVKLPSFGTKPFVVGSCNGLLCFHSYQPNNLVLVNPSTGIYRQIPVLVTPKRLIALNFGFGYDSQNDDYKIVRIVVRCSSLFLSSQIERITQVYSLKANSWKLVELKSSPEDRIQDRKNGALINNHLLLWKFWVNEESMYRVRCFDLCKEQWVHDVPLVDYNDGLVQSSVLDLGVIDGYLYLSMKNQQNSGVDVWVMKEYGVKESWVKLFQISNPRVLRSLRVAPVASRNGGREILLRVGDCKSEVELLWYNIKDETLENVEIHGVEDYTDWVDICKGSLVTILGGRQIGSTN